MKCSINPRRFRQPTYQRWKLCHVQNAQRDWKLKQIKTTQQGKSWTSTQKNFFWLSKKLYLEFIKKWSGKTSEEILWNNKSEKQ